ncbi:MAG: hypothetical protein GXP26_02575 [Planctomycetes bacterium]|nr:hypothetical protein [Planctomycetota bacterium]
MIARRETSAILALVFSCSALTALAQHTVTEDTRNGVRYQVTTRTVQRQVPVTVMQDRQQTVYTQQITTNHIAHQQLYNVPVTQYQWESRLNGRWNPFITPYWTHNLRPVTTWRQQVANVQIPVSNVAWVPQTKTVQVPVVQYRMAEEQIVTRVPIGNTSTLASTLSTATPTTARIAARPSVVPLTSNTQPIGGVQMTSDPPRKSTGWQTQQPSSRYR